MIAAVLLALSACANPPAIPHMVSQVDDTWCTSCHLEGDNGAPVSPHPLRRNCVGCHAAQGTADVGARGGVADAGDLAGRTG